MFHLVNKYGNVCKKVESERKRDELIDAGYRLAEEPVEEPAVDGVAPYNGPQQADEPQQVDDPLQMHTTEDDAQGNVAIGDDTEGVTEEGKQTADDLNTTEDDTQAVKDPEPATALEPKPEDKEPKPVKSPKTTGGKTTKGATKSTKANKTEKE